ncbi:MAG: zinc ribbon domain-containing protein [Candidatus Omnitrophica bacterium]|nr:zinc ribbon domain-containing protein [Candidatus Omnitrophota bacterium]
MKKCPYCFEQIQDEAIKCRFCSEFLDGREAGDAQAKEISWYFKPSTLVLGFCLIGPLIIPLIWFHPRYSNTKKAVLTLVCIAVTILFLIPVKASMKSLGEYYRVLQGDY